jgi:hypothetical protein
VGNFRTSGFGAFRTETTVLLNVSSVFTPEPVKLLAKQQQRINLQYVARCDPPFPLQP